MNASRLVAWTLAAALLAACGRTAGPIRATVDTAKIIDTIKTDEVHWNADYRSGDAGKVAAHYASTGVAMFPGALAAVGTAAIESTVKPAFSDPRFVLSFASDRVDVAASGDLAVAHGTYKVTATDPKTGAAATETGAYVNVYRPRADGAWKAVLAINTPGAPAPETTTKP